MHLCLDADRILLQYEILEGHTQLTHLHFMLPPFCRLRHLLNRALGKCSHQQQ
jgi:hypothetical protein